MQEGGFFLTSRREEGGINRERRKRERSKGKGDSAAGGRRGGVIS